MKAFVSCWKDFRSSYRRCEHSSGDEGILFGEFLTGLIFCSAGTNMSLDCDSQGGRLAPRALRKADRRMGWRWARLSMQLCWVSQSHLSSNSWSRSFRPCVKPHRSGGADMLSLHVGSRMGSCLPVWVCSVEHGPIHCQCLVGGQPPPQCQF